jgi:hypothetical protein
MERLQHEIQPARPPAAVALAISKNRGLQLVFVLTVAVVIAATGSHWLTGWLKIKTKAAQPVTIGKPNGKPPAFLAGSSLADYGISWDQISTQADTEIKVWGIAGGSPVEFEQFQKQVPEARTTFIVVSVYDLDEAMICDFRAELVPLSRTIQTLMAIHADWSYSERALSQYPMTWLRTLFPTLGRSRGLMGLMRFKIIDLAKTSSPTSATQAGPTIRFGKGTTDDEYRQQRLSDWSGSKIISKLVAMRDDFQGSQSFNGPKRLAFERMLQYAGQRGRTIVIVLPVSPAYSKEFMSPALVREFEAALTDAQHSAPRSEWLPLDQLPGLASNENFCDLIHLNVFGNRIATEALQTRLQQPPYQP